MNMNEKNVEVGDFVRITNNRYRGLDFIVGNYYEVLVVHDNGVVGLMDGEGIGVNVEGWSFRQTEFDDVRKGGIMTQQWQEMTQEEVMNVQVGDKIRIDGVETEVVRLYDRDFPDYGFCITVEVKSVGIISHCMVMDMRFKFEKPVTQSAHTIPSLANKKIWVKDLTEDQKKRIQDVAFEQGFSWSGSQSYRYLHAIAYFTNTDDNTITFVGPSSSFFEETPREEITYEEIFGEASARVIEVGDRVRVIASQQELEEICATDILSGGVYKINQIWGNGCDLGVPGMCSSVILTMIEPVEEDTVIEIPSRLVPTVDILQKLCSKANVQVLTRPNSFTIYSEEDEREIVCSTEEELFDILDQLVTIQEMSEKIGWTF